tara:strand:+ start:2984 stop:4168 length:1185 start_codon:yes stop_codon:yes gene_type:complete
LQFQTLDDKKDCVGIYCDGSLYFNQELPEEITHTWSYSAFLENKDIQYAKLYCGGKSLDDVCPESLKDRWEHVRNRFESFIKSFTTARVSLNENCFYDLVPHKFLLEFCYIKDLICKHVFKTYQKPDNYEYLLGLTKEIETIRHQKLNIATSNLSLAKTKHRRFLTKLRETSPYCKFNITGTKTGRLTTFKNSFPILTLDKELRVAMVPQNDYYVELDFNAAELRTLLALQGKEQPQEDMHMWNINNIFGGEVSRADAKKRIFAWLYNPSSHDSACERFYNRESILNEYYNAETVTTIFGKEIKSEERTALNYIIQSTCAENVLRQMVKVSDHLRGRKSYIAFPIHDSIVIDFSTEDNDLLKNIIDIFATTDLGKFMVNVSAGTNFGQLKKVGA